MAKDPVPPYLAPRPPKPGLDWDDFPDVSTTDNTKTGIAGTDSYGRGPVNLGELNVGETQRGSADAHLRGGLLERTGPHRDRMMSYEDALNYPRTLRAAARADGATKADKDAYKDFTTALKAYSGSDYESLGGELTAWDGVLKDAQNGDDPALALLDTFMSDPNRSRGDGGGGGAYAGPVQSNVSSIMADEDIPRTLNEFATEMLGRNLTEKEMNKYTKKFKKQDRENEQISLRTPNGPAQSSTVTQEKVTRDTIARNIMQENPAYADQTINTDVLDIFAKRLGI